MPNFLINGDKIMTGNTQAPANDFIFAGSLTAATTTAVGGILKLQNTYGVDLLVLHMIIQVTTKSTGAATADIGTNNAGDASSDNLLDGMNMETVKAHSSLVGGGTNGGVALWKKNEYIVATASASVAGLVGTYKILAKAN